MKNSDQPAYPASSEWTKKRNDGYFEEMGLTKRTVLADVAKCQSCGKNNGTDELHSCPYNADINNDDSPCCNCCSDCCHECAMDI